MDVTFWVYGENTSEDILATLENIENQCKLVGVPLLLSLIIVRFQVLEPGKSGKRFISHF